MCLLLRFAEGSEEHACGWVPRDLNDLTFHEKSKEMIIKNRLSSLSCLCPQKTSSSSIFFFNVLSRWVFLNSSGSAWQGERVCIRAW